jgi:hypothetical protein
MINIDEKNTGPQCVKLLLIATINLQTKREHVKVQTLATLHDDQNYCCWHKGLVCYISHYPLWFIIIISVFLIIYICRLILFINTHFKNSQQEENSQHSLWSLWIITKYFYFCLRNHLQPTWFTRLFSFIVSQTYGRNIPSSSPQHFVEKCSYACIWVCKCETMMLCVSDYVCPWNAEFCHRKHVWEV